jgi:hypothetical protein
MSTKPYRWPEHRRDETQVRAELLAAHPEIWAGLRDGHDPGDEDAASTTERWSIRCRAADMLDAAMGV